MLANVRRRLGARLRPGFNTRLLLAIALTLGLIGAFGYVVLDRRLQDRLVESYSVTLKADAESLEAIGGRSADDSEAIRESQEILDSVGRRPGTMEARLIDGRGIVRASGDPDDVGVRDLDQEIAAAVHQRRSYAGRERDPDEDAQDFEFIEPVELRGKPFALEMAFDHREFAAQMHDVRATLALIGVLVLFGGGLVFYLAGGRSLMRSHRRALERATRDGLTDLPNHRAFQEESAHATALAARHDERLCLAMLDLDDFKLVNDRYGHPRGDALLLSVADVLRVSRAGDRAYRIGGDEFAIVLPAADLAGARVAARRVRRELRSAGAHVSIGLAELRPGQSAGGLQAEADAALYEAKRRGGDRVVGFDEIRDEVSVIAPERMEAVRRLIDERRLDTVFQPIWDFRSQRMIGLEALSRPHPSYGLSGPAEAFDIAAQIGLVRELDVLCVGTALERMPELPADTLLFLNLSPHTLDLEGNQWLIDSVESAGLPADRVVLEVTERFGGRTAGVVKSLDQLREHGFRIALDDVGAGNSGLERLRALDVEFVKLDRGMVSAAQAEPNARAVLMAMATFANETGAYVIAEGIEDQDLLDFVRQVGDEDRPATSIIQGGQGFELGRPQSMPAAEPRPAESLPALRAD